MDLLPSQLKNIITNSIEKDGLEHILKIVLNCLMKLERKYYLEENSHLEKNKANGFRSAYTYGMGKKIELKVPRDRLGNFYPTLLMLLKDEEEEIQNMAFELYSKGLSVRDVSDIFEKIYGKKYNKSSISKMNQKFKEEIYAWRNRPLEKHYPILIIDALHSKVRRVDSIENEATYTVLGVKEDMSRDILAIEHIPVESAGGWEIVLKRLKDRGIKTTSLIIADGLTGLETSISKVFPEALFQKCVVHFKRNILRKVKSKHKAAITKDLKLVFDLDDKYYTYKKGIKNFNHFIDKWKKYYRFIGNMKNSMNITYYFTYLEFDYRVRNMLYTTNWVENLNKQFRRVLKIRNSMPTEESIVLLLGKVALSKTEKYLKYPIYNFKFDKKLFPRND